MQSNINGWTRTVQLKPPSLKDNTADADRLVAAIRSILQIDDVSIDYSILRDLPRHLRKNDFTTKCVLFKEGSQWALINLVKPGKQSSVLGCAIDLGTSRVVLRLIDLESGRAISETSFDNPQISIGPDILERIHFADGAEGLKTLNRLIIDKLNQATDRLCKDSGFVKEEIYLMSVAGNTAMTHLFLGLEPRWIIREPYIPVTNRPGLIRTQEIGININPAGRIFVFPNVGSYFGGDVIAGILFAGLHSSEETAILVDVGTNAEVVVGNQNWLIACAGAAGPALEGGVTRMGMMAGSGVIDHVTINRETKEFVLGTIDDESPRGICGSGLIDLAAELFRAGMINIQGKLVPDACAHRLTERHGINHLMVLPAEKMATGEGLTVSQADLDSLIRSKAAMYTILETITESVGVTLNDLASFYVAGTFGSFINPRSAITLGMLPDLPLARYKPLGNSSLEGAARALLSTESIGEIERIRDHITYLELNVNQDFMNRFSAAKFLPHTDASRFPSVKIPT